MKCIADVNVLLPLLCGGHIAETVAYRWFETKGPGPIGWCLPIRLAILRHLSNRHIMGDGVLDPEQVLDAWKQLEADERMFEITAIPDETEKYLRANVRERNSSPKIWTDAWIAAVAEASGLQVVSFDTDFKSFHLSAVEILVV